MYSLCWTVMTGPLHVLDSETKTGCRLLLHSNFYFCQLLLLTFNICIWMKKHSAALMCTPPPSMQMTLSAWWERRSPSVLRFSASTLIPFPDLFRQKSLVVIPSNHHLCSFLLRQRWFLLREALSFSMFSICIWKNFLITVPGASFCI